MDFRRAWAVKDAESQAVWQTVVSEAEKGGRLETARAWSAAIPFEQPSGSTGYLPGRGDVILGVLPFYDFLYFPISMYI